MPPVKDDPAKVKTFESAIVFDRWLGVHHHEEDEVWIRIYKVGSGLKSITPREAIDVCLCWGWIDAVRKRLDDKSYLQRYTRRRKRSIWSQINVDNVTRLIAEGRMTEHGLAEHYLAKCATLFVGYRLRDYNLRLLFRTLHWQMSPSPKLLRGFQARSTGARSAGASQWRGSDGGHGHVVAGCGLQGLDERRHKLPDVEA